MWLRKFSGPTVLYTLLRYGTLFEKIAILFLASWYLTPRVFVTYPSIIGLLFLTKALGMRHCGTVPDIPNAIAVCRLWVYVSTL
jgi:hypothetical protein